MFIAAACPHRLIHRFLCRPASDIELTDGGWSEVMSTKDGVGKAKISKLAPNKDYTHTYKTSVGVSASA